VRAIENIGAGFSDQYETCPLSSFLLGMRVAGLLNSGEPPVRLRSRTRHIVTGCGDERAKDLFRKQPCRKDPKDALTWPVDLDDGKLGHAGNRRPPVKSVDGAQLIAPSPAYISSCRALCHPRNPFSAYAAPPVVSQSLFRAECDRENAVWVRSARPEALFRCNSFAALSLRDRKSG
jgi:hypothetical protein